MNDEKVMQGELTCPFCGDRIRFMEKMLFGEHRKHRSEDYPKVLASGEIDLDSGKVTLDKKPTIGDPNYSSGHSIDVDGNCNMGLLLMWLKKRTKIKTEAIGTY